MTEAYQALKEKLMMKMLGFIQTQMKMKS